MKIKTRFLLILALCVVGLIGSIGLSLQKAQSQEDNPVFCIADEGSCDSVLISDYSQMFGVSMGTWGSLYFLVVIVLLFITAKDWLDYDLARIAFYVLLTGGVLFSLSLVGIMFLVLKQLCSNCLLVHTLNFLLSGVLVYHIRTEKKIV